MRRGGSIGRSGGRRPAPDRAALVAGIVLALLLVAVILAALLYGAGALRDGPHDPLNLGEAAPEAAPPEASARPS